MDDFDYSVPVLVAGGGACGAVAALAAAAAGAEVLVIEQDDQPRGSTAMSQGLICAAGTKAQRDRGIDDGPETYFADIMAKTRGLTDPALARLIADEAGPCLDWLVAEYGLPFELDVRFRASYGNSRLRVHGWPGHGGEDLIQFLHQRLAERDIAVLPSARLVDLIADHESRVLGIIVERPDGARERIGCETLILATSGFGANRTMVARHMPELASAHYHGHEGNQGLGIELGTRLGGAVADMGSYQGYGMLAAAQGVSLPPGAVLEGGILVNALGQRFIDELADIAGMIHPVLAQPGHMAWAIYDAGIEARCAHIPETQQLIALKAAKHADDLAGLAAILAVPEAVLRATLDDAWTAAGPDSVGRVWQDVRPPEPPYRALKVTGALYHTQGGLQIDGSARVLREDGSPLPNLFAGGGAARGVSGPSFWGYLPAMGLCAAVTLGRVAGRAAASLSISRTAKEAKGADASARPYIHAR